MKYEAWMNYAGHTFSRGKNLLKRVVRKGEAERERKRKELENK